ncbi:MAG: alpha-galactosidase [Lachnospiraceae bacterium]|nr:alpha-galactosidase [Lachnospiraceae bacterium]
MPVNHYEVKNSYVKDIFKLDTPNTTYCIGIVDEGYVGHIYYGKKIEDPGIEHILRIDEMPWVPSKNNRDKSSFLDSFPMEFPTHGIGDYREDCLSVESSGGNFAVGLIYDSYEIINGKNKISGLPSTFGSDKDVTSLVIHCIDEPLKLSIDLIYSVFEDLDVITRSVKVTNNSKDSVFLKKIYSACLDMDNDDFVAVTLHGSWARERHMVESEVNRARVSIDSTRGESSHQMNPFLMIKNADATDESGEVYAMNFVYSGNFHASVAEDQFGQIRMLMGINSEDFKWKLREGDTFEAPEVVMVYSSFGTGHMTRTFHDLYRKHLIRSPYKDKKRPILINNWEATYFDFNEEKLISIAREASKLGIEMLVMDDGWFGHREDDNTSLGDWIVNEEKLKGGLKYLADEVNKLGMKFGIWFEPEMVSPLSDLYREHPDWAIAIPGRVPTLSRNQYVLDITREEVRDYVYESVAKVLRSANIEYVKWDMNRQLSDIGSVSLPKERMGELFHRYVLGVYDLQERLISEFPNLLLENCSGGGARFDPGMLFYGPQIWCSDDTDAVERLIIQEGTALVYPLSSMGAHVSDCPNHTVGRVTPFETRGHVALAGTFGYELDVTKIPKEDKDMIPSQTKMYHKYNDLVREGDYYRVASYSKNGQYDCYGVVSKDKKEALYTYVQVMMRPNYHSRKIKFKGLDPKRNYKIEGEDRTYTGEILMNAGYLVKNMWGDFKSCLIHIMEAD